MKKPIDNKTKLRIDSGICVAEARIVGMLGVTTGRFSCRNHNLSNGPNRSEDFIMSDEEIYARDYLADCTAHNISATMMHNKLTLTDNECYHISKNFIYSYCDIRAIFATPIYKHYTSPTRTWIASGPNIQDMPRKISDKIIKNRNSNK